MISVIIPTLNAEKELPGLLSAIKSQKPSPYEIIVIDSGSEDKTKEICRSFNTVRLIEIQRSEFDHGRTRDFGLRSSHGDVVVFLTQDALPIGEEFLLNLVSPLSDGLVAVSTGRQIPKENASKMEKLVRTFNYPEESHVRSKEDLQNMGIKTFFSSDVCAAYNREIYLSLGGFEYPVLTNEDMFYAAKAINSGYKIAYAANAQVFHSHDYSLREQYIRNYAQGYEIERHRELLGEVSKESEGVKLVKFVSSKLLSHGLFLSFIRFGLDCVARYLGSAMGRRAYIKEFR